MSQTKRPRLAVAVGLALATAVVATSFVRSGHAVKAVKVATDDALASTSGESWVDVPSMAVTMSVPTDTQALFLITFSADNICSGNSACLIRALINGTVVAPGQQVFFGTPYEGTNSMQFLASPMPAGTYTIKIQYFASGGSTFSLYSRTLSVLRSVV